MGYLKLTTSDIRMPAKVTPLPRSSDVNLRARRLAPTPANGRTSLAWRRSACSCADRAALRSGVPRSRWLRSREPAPSRRHGPEVRDAAAGAAGAERSGSCCADRRFAAGNANADWRAHPRCAPAERAVRGHDLFRRDSPELARALVQDASIDLAFSAGFSRRRPSAGETTSSARAEACRRVGQRSARSPRGAKRSRGGSRAEARQNSDRRASARSDARGGGHGID